MTSPIDSNVRKKCDFFAQIIKSMSDVKVGHTLIPDYNTILEKLELYRCIVKSRMMQKFNEHIKILDNSIEETEVNLKQLSVIEVLNEKYYNKDVVFYLTNIDSLYYVSNIFYLQINIPFTIEHVLPKHYKTYMLTTDVKNNIFNIKTIISKLNYFYDNNIGYSSTNKNICKMYHRISDDTMRHQWFSFILIAKNIVGQFDVLPDDVKSPLCILITKLKLYIPRDCVITMPYLFL
jgi:hypothetical protein